MGRGAYALSLIVSVAITQNIAKAETKIVDGFRVTLDAAPAVAKLKFPQAVTYGNILLEMGGATNGGEPGSDPFAYNSKLSGVTPYFAISGGGSLGYTSESGFEKFTILWGTPDSYNTLSFYNSSNVQIGATITGGDLASAFQLNATVTPYYIIIALPSLATSAILSRSRGQSVGAGFPRLGLM